MLHTRSLALFIVFTVLLALPSSAMAQTPHPETPAKPTSDRAEIDALKSDLNQMRVILNQMATNLAFVQDTQSPLKHQFQLDIEMWQVLMTQMQRRIDRLEGTSAKPAQ